jgi:hypothetical protein
MVCFEFFFCASSNAACSVGRVLRPTLSSESSLFRRYSIRSQVSLRSALNPTLRSARMQIHIRQCLHCSYRKYQCEHQSMDTRLLRLLFYPSVQISSLGSGADSSEYKENSSDSAGRLPLHRCETAENVYPPLLDRCQSGRVAVAAAVKIARGSHRDCRTTAIWKTGRTQRARARTSEHCKGGLAKKGGEYAPLSLRKIRPVCRRQWPPAAQGLPFHVRKALQSRGCAIGLLFDLSRHQAGEVTTVPVAFLFEILVIAILLKCQFILTGGKPPLKN